MTTLLGPAFNLSILLFILAFYLRKPLKEFVHNRFLSIRKELAEAKKSLEEATERFNHFSEKLKKVDRETLEMSERIKTDAIQTKERILLKTKDLEKQILQDAKEAAKSIESETAGKLVSDFGLRIVARAESILTKSLTGDDRVRIRKDFSSQVESA